MDAKTMRQEFAQMASRLWFLSGGMERTTAAALRDYDAAHAPSLPEEGNTND